MAKFYSCRAAPQLSNQGRTILFLVAGRDGAYNILHLMLGAFHESRSGTQSLAVRDLSEATEVSMPSITGARASGSLKKPRDFEAFAEWLADRGRGVLRNGDYVLESVESSAFAQPFGLNPPPFRYFDFDEGGSVDWFFPASGQPGLAGGGVTEFQEALDAWNSEPVSNVNLELEGTTDSTAGFTVDGINNITVGDPNSEIPGTFTCGQGGGGVAGLGGGGMSAGTGIYRGQTYFQFGEVNIVIQDGVECLFSQVNGRSSAAELYAHELDTPWDWAIPVDNSGSVHRAPFKTKR